jgi:hypothetical protein
MDTTTALHARRERSQGQRMKRYERRDAKRAFLMSYAEQGVARTACKIAGISRSLLYSWLKADARFNAKYEALTAAHYDARWMYMSKDEVKHYMRARRQGERLIRYYQQRETEKNRGDWTDLTLSRAYRQQTRP